mmetsp:Transcript_36185/g.144615  ORF Transcript_36185/g.144615 Transcript_36185/m.144615 type:complete len:204 (+) Transcript_36185:3666-4277(+)|eukprot:CAMPEP_0113955636 /NCGR_PEP_ID=MMETSP0011_2-20120614/1481_1 /TAXON_ID=101924 /ORGANISM="Rhodosorus marinus" /LENGTH=203 /DNA_ID=CAMNT_0000965423 /DNA_START=701 /DNA_END=1312 /DNA_ORIENTATION=+ /assembly_acc=CAM_ASM_000156
MQGSNGGGRSRRKAQAWGSPADIKVSKKLSFWLRHRPDKAGLVLDQNGWANVDEVLTALSESGCACGWEGLLRVVDTNDKQRFALSPDGSLIRARQGHSVHVDLGLKPVTPPEVLYHGTVERFWCSIAKDGLKKMNRHHVHLSSEISTASKVGSRRGQPVILEISAADMYKNGEEFFLTENGVWLTNSVPSEFIRRRDDLEGL